jgi:hypothetical protein
MVRAVRSVEFLEVTAINFFILAINGFMGHI